MCPNSQHQISIYYISAHFVMSVKSKEIAEEFADLSGYELSKKLIPLKPEDTSKLEPAVQRRPYIWCFL